MWDIAWVGIPCAAAGVAYLLLADAVLLPDRRPAISLNDDPRQYTVEMSVDPAGPLVNQTIEVAGLRHLPGLYLAEIDRGGDVLPAVGPKERLQANDRLVFVGDRGIGGRSAEDARSAARDGPGVQIGDRRSRTGR